MFNDVMIDLESTGHTHDAVMIQLGAVFFDRTSGELGEKFCVNIGRQSCIDAGFIETQSTLDWWAKQNQEVFKSIQEDTYEIVRALIMFRDFIGEKNHKVKVWSHATFDFVIVQNYLRRFKMEPLPYKGARDIRTLTDLSGLDLNAYDWNKKTHNALDDCIFQVEYCTDAFKKLNARHMVSLLPEHVEHILEHEVGEELIVTNGLYNIEVKVIYDGGKKDIQLVKVWRGDLEDGMEPGTYVEGNMKAIGNKNG